VENKDIYLFKDFTLANYRRLLELAKERFRFTSFQDYPSEKGNFIILRHDLEFSPPLALEMAKIERDFGIKSTTFVNIHSEYYNCLEKKTFNVLRQLVEMGHTLELHLDAHFYGIRTEQQLCEKLKKEQALFADMFNVQIKTFSFHNTTPAVLQFDKTEYAGIQNTYSAKLKSEMAYCADSTGFWRYERLEEVLKDKNTTKLQLLIHDGMWQITAMAPRQRIHKVIDDNAAWLRNYYDDTLVKFKAKNVDYDKVL